MPAPPRAPGPHVLTGPVSCGNATRVLLIACWTRTLAAILCDFGLSASQPHFDNTTEEADLLDRTVYVSHGDWDDVVVTWLMRMHCMSRMNHEPCERETDRNTGKA